jgi:hypothetical protein
VSKGLFYVVHLSASVTATEDDVKTIMNKALDWYQVSENFWVLYSTSHAKLWRQRLKPVVKEDGRVFICALDHKNRAGWMGKQFWEWLRKDRAPKT